MIWDPYGAFQTHTLENGLTIHAVQMSCPWQRIRCSIHSGGTQDPEDKLGLAHFTEHLLSQNAPLPCEEINDYFNDLGGDAMLGATSYWKTYYSFYIPAKDDVLKQSLDLFGKMLLSAKLEKNIERERQVILNEFHKKYPVSFKYDIQMKTHEVLFKGMAMGRSLDTLGNPATIKTIEAKDVQSFYDEHYTPANMTIVAVGAYSLEQLVKFFSESSFAITKQGSRNVLEPIVSFPDVDKQRIEIVISDYVDTKLFAPSFSYESYVKIPLSFSEAAVAICCRMLTDLLDEEVRQNQGWTYGISSKYSQSPQFNKMQIFSASIAIVALDCIEEKIDGIISAIINSEALFEKIRNNKLAASLMDDESGSMILNTASEEIFYHGKTTSMSEHQSNLRTVTFQDVCDVAAYWKTKKRITVINRP
ncbi:MAG: pitrilysin family protein [Candidatus Paceibacterota bacterium]